MHVARIKDANLQRRGPPIQTGEVHGASLSDRTTAKQLFIGFVKFSPGGRTVWHTHPFEQGLIIVEGKGIVATEAEEHVVEPGDVVVIPAHEKHWHGATNTSGMAHININGEGQTVPLEPVDTIRTPGV
jgi:4-carboxymuconolactone decarboxylase